MLGLKKGTVLLTAHQTAWETQAQQMITKLREVLGSDATDIQHIGSTSVKTIAAKPIIDIAIGMETLDKIDRFLAPLAKIGVQKSAGQPFAGIVLFSKDDAETGERLYNIQAVVYGLAQWNGHICFRDYMNANPDKASEYEQIKKQAAELYPADVMRYSAQKNAFIEQCIEVLHEKSCGTVPYTKQDGEILYLLVRARDDGYCGFPKGHAEPGETEQETALRETWEETSLTPTLIASFRYVTSYTMSGGRHKTVVYFPALFADQTPMHQNGFEEFDYLLLPYEQARAALTFENARNMLQEINAFLLSR